MASRLTLSPAHFYTSKNIHLVKQVKSRHEEQYFSRVNSEEQWKNGLLRHVPTIIFPFKGFSFSSRWKSFCVFVSFSTSAAEFDGPISADEAVAVTRDSEIEFNRVNCLVWVLHESARGFSLAIQAHELARNGPELAMAWNGTDVHAWHKHIAYQVAVYALLKAAMEVELFLSHKRSSNRSPVNKILSSNANLLGERIENHLNMRNPKLGQWFRMVELPRMAGLFVPLFKKWSLDYAGSGIAGIVLAVSCCAAIGKLGSGRIAFPLFSVSIEDALVELMVLSDSLVSVDKLHQLATEAGFEEEFLSHFGSMVLPSKNVEDIEFWIGLVQGKLSTAFQREGVIADKSISLKTVQESVLATLGLFAYLGRETRLFLSGNGINDLDEQTKDFLSYLECGSLLLYPEFSTLSEYQQFMEVVIHEIGWLDFYAVYICEFSADKKRSRPHAVQAEKEIILYSVLTVCYDVFSGFAHYSNSTKQLLDANLLDFLLHSQSLLSACLEDYWAAYDRTDRLQRAADGWGSDQPQSLFVKDSTNLSALREKNLRKEQPKPVGLVKQEKCQHGFTLNQDEESIRVNPIKLGCFLPATKPPQENFLRKSVVKMISASADVWMGTQLLLIDIRGSLKLVVKKLLGRKLTQRERKKMERTLSDIATLVPVTILMLLPVSAVGHAAIFAAINKYMPCLIPSPYSSERLGFVKQFKRTKKMEVQLQNRIEDASTETRKPSQESQTI